MSNVHGNDEGVIRDIMDVQSIEDTHIPISQDAPIENPSVPITTTGVSSTILANDSEHPEVNKIKRKRSLTSVVWNDYERTENLDGSITAKCKYSCTHKTSCDSSKGTTHLSTHTKNCRRRPRADIRQAILTSSGNTTNIIGTYRFDAEVERTLFAQLVMKHDYPFLFIEHEFFRKWVTFISPMYKFKTRNTINSDCLDVYKIQKAKLQSIFDGISSRISLTIDLWTPDHQNLWYCCVSCRYIDDSWKLNKKIIAFNFIECPHTGEVLGNWLKQKILEWNIDKKVYSIVVDNASNNVPMVMMIKNWLNSKGYLLKNGDLFHIRCSAYIINLIIKSGMEIILSLIEKIRKSVKYIGSSVYRNQKFKQALTQSKLNDNKKVSLDVDTRWNSTYLMLESALEVIDAFERLADLDFDYKELPIFEKWEMGKKV